MNQRELWHLSAGQQRAWLQRVAYYKWIDHNCHVRVWSIVPLDEAIEQVLVDEARSPELLVLRDEEHALLHQLLSQLPEHYQTILLLRLPPTLRQNHHPVRSYKRDSCQETFQLV